ncbi:MAG: bifunctional hydroxymethylpyrimidine kinase/phosphomethylpyrimidine kinase [Myxococcaceae bacterium]|jgi:hydroxymethylpyrimidine/phosphomethylpyrimidine kinase|nr:bifunctional hydroxymethylpyrimidine kinase/phosphomethylpyrimidine kinase [Myxococcaceae bacterium]MCA3014770.1 bifunctional hydroxymethylpyrimidine kinase/phosphomethylpyrimidine kinase [Myxococcaceae bacterium]
MTGIALTIAGSDPSGGAGLQADLKTFHQHGVYGTSVVTLLTVQSTRGVARVEPLPADLVDQQLSHLLDDVTPGAAKTGALGTAALVDVVATRARTWAFPLVVDPVMISKHGHRLIDEAAVEALRLRLLPVCALVTPNAHEAGHLAGAPVETLAQAREAARRIAGLGARAVLVKGGHLTGAPIDVLFSDGRTHEFPADRIDTPHTHGTGCTFSAAITARLALGEPLVDAVAGAKTWLTEAIRTGPRFGGGVGPVNHLAPLPRRAAAD